MNQPLTRAKTSLVPARAATALMAPPAYQAYRILHVGFVVLPILAGLDKFFYLLVNWDQYLAPVAARVLPVSGHTFMMLVGIIETPAARARRRSLCGRSNNC